MNHEVAISRVAGRRRPLAVHSLQGRRTDEEPLVSGAAPSPPPLSARSLPEPGRLFLVDAVRDQINTTLLFSHLLLDYYHSLLFPYHHASGLKGPPPHPRSAPVF